MSHPEHLALTDDEWATAVRIWEAHPDVNTDPTNAMCDEYAVSEGGTRDQAYTILAGVRAAERTTA